MPLQGDYLVTPFAPYGGKGVPGFGGYPTEATPGGGAMPGIGPQGGTNSFNPIAYGGYTGGAADWSQYYGGLGATAYNQMQQAASDVQQRYAQQGQGAVNRSLTLGTQGANYAATMGEGLYQGAMGQGQSLYGTALDEGQSQSNYANAIGAQGQAGLGALATGELGRQQLAMANASHAMNLQAGAAEGRAPSAAQTMMGQGIGAGLRAELAGAASARGGAYAQAAARDQAAQQGGALMAGGIGQASQLRAQEMAQARDAYAGTAAGMYGTTGGLASGYAQAGEQARLQGLGIGTQAQTQGLNIGTGAATSALGIGTGAATAGAGQLAGLAGETMGATNAADLGFANLGEQGEMGYTQLGSQERQNLMNMQNQVNNSQLQANLQYNAEALGLAGQTAQIQAAQQQQLTGGLLGAGAGLVGGASDERLKTDVSPQGGGFVPASEQDKARLIRDNPYGEDYSLYPPGVGPTAQPAQSAAQGHSYDTLKQMLAAMRGMGQGAVRGMSQTPNLAATQAPGVSSPAPPMVSDERAKESVSPAPTADALLQMLQRSKSTFAYKNPADQPLTPQHPHIPGARFGGVMAQDLERVPEIGRQMVTDTPRGKQLEPGAVQGALLMGLGRLAERVRALEGSHATR